MATPPSSSDPARPGGPRRRSVLRGGDTTSGSSVPPRTGAPAARSSSSAGRTGPSGPVGTAARKGARKTAPKGGAKGGRRGRRRLVDYPRQGKRGVRRWLPSWRLVLGTVLTVIALGMGAFVGLYVTTSVPSPGDFVQAQTTTVYFADGKTPIGTFAEQNRVIIDKSAIPQHMKDAVVASEDRTFYTNPGIDILGIARTFYENIRTGARHGGSSITQQYAERYYSNSTISSYQGKLREAILALKLDRRQDKDVIVSNYLNTIYFGRDSYGVQQAAKAYFGVDAKDLTIAQSALLAGVLPAPNDYDPRVSLKDATRRWNYVLDGMVTTGALTEAERKAQVFPETIEYSRSNTYAGPNGYLLQMVRDEITRTTPLTDQDLDQNGYSIVTTIDPTLQADAVAAVKAMPADKPANLHVALVTLDPTDGGILALYGGPDAITQARNAVTQDNAQAGSTFKPFALTAYLENGGSLKSTYSGANGLPMAGFPNGKVTNYAGEQFGTIDLVKATADSVNTVYAQINKETGPDKTLKAAVTAGLPADTVGLNDQLSNVLGPASPHPIDMAHAYNTIAAGGMRTEPFIVRTITTLGGELVHTGGVAPERVFPADVMADVTYAMEHVAMPGGTAPRAGTIGYPVAGKTGTSTDNKSGWFIGFTRQLTTAVALYQVGPGGSEESITPFGGYRVITGGTAPADLWAAYMKTAMAGRDKQDFPPPAYVGKPNVPQPVALPDVVGETESQARTDLGAAGFTSQAVVYANDPTIAAGLVISTDPTGQALVSATITITVSSGPGQIPVPEVTGKSAADATAALKAAGFTVVTTQASDPTTPVGDVVRTDPAAGTPAAPGSSVTIVVSTGPAAAPSPSPTSVTSPTPTPTP